jgi:hypothetical protein
MIYKGKNLDMSCEMSGPSDSYGRKNRKKRTDGQQIREYLCHWTRKEVWKKIIIFIHRIRIKSYVAIRA